MQLGLVGSSSTHRAKGDHLAVEVGQLVQRAIALLLCLSLIGTSTMGCRGPQPSPPPPAPSVVGYIVGAPDVLQINILPEPEIDRTVRVRPDGKISVDLVGDVQAAGRTPQQIAQAIQTEISRFKRDAAVNVTVVESPSQFITVFGEVARPGTFPLDTETRVSEAIGLVGGTLPFASLNKVRIIRNRGNNTKVFTVRLADISHGDLSTNMVVDEGDLIVVPPNPWARFGYVMNLIFFPFSPLLNAASAAVTVDRAARLGN